MIFADGIGDYTLLERHSGFHTDNADVVRSALIDDLGATHFDLRDRSKSFSLELHWSRRKEVTLVSSVCSDASNVNYAPATFVRQYFELSPNGRYRFSFANSTAELFQTSPSVVVPCDTPFRVESSANHDLLVLRIDESALNRRMRSLLGDDLPCDIRFEKTSGVDSPKQRSMRQAVIQFATDLDSWAPAMSSVAHTELEQALVARFLLCNEHNFSAKLDARPPSPSSSQLQRVEDFIEANWEKPLDIEVLAQISNISTRSLFRHFRKAHGISPFEHVKRVRLKHTHRLLQAGSERESVISVALRCGFQSLGHFARDYRKAYGELPSETLRRASSLKRRQ